MILVSACLLGLKTRYDMEIKKDAKLITALEGTAFIPICPEQLGGLPTPRKAARLHGGDGRAVLIGRATVINEAGMDVTEHFVKGAQECLKIARMAYAKLAYLKAKSPSCGITPHLGVTAALFLQNGIKVIEV